MAEVLERTCKGCGDWALCFDGYCGDCAPASAVDAYVAWWNSPAGALHREVLLRQWLASGFLERDIQAAMREQLESGEDIPF